ncbi:MAG TPA: methyl-accepting chemotaxis protein [Burkholderiaceae bacterium]|nr:methyl-accepting chemotaxis protein [Burkholderiaceae bacterium]
MIQHWTFGQKISAGFAVIIALTIAIGALSIYALRDVVASKDRIITVNSHLLLDAERLNGRRDEKAAAIRGFLLTGEERFLDQMRETRREIGIIVGRLKRGAVSDEGRRQVEAFERAETEHQNANERVIALRRTTANAETVSRAFEEQVGAARKQLDTAVDAFVAREERLLNEAQQAGTDSATSVITLVLSATVAAVALAALVAYVLARALGAQIGTAVGHVRSSSAELQASANQQATGAKEQAAAMAEINTTISELLATSRQIAESAQRVAQIAGETTGAARSGEGTVEQAHESIGGIRRQVDLVVSHMLELGKKSQQIGTVLDIVSELAEQTNILAINATIEAAGAGESGKRFAVVADEIRELADRVAGSTKEIRALIDDVRGAVNTTVMATETGSKAVDTGSAKFGEVSAAFKQIAGLLKATTEAAREIELSTKQQASAVEQVNLAIASVAQTTRETEVSSGQTLETVSQLSNLSKDLSRLVQAQAAA